MHLLDTSSATAKAGRRVPDLLVLPVAPRANARTALETTTPNSSTVLTPAQALALTDRALATDPPPCGVVLAGPGEPLATPSLTLQTLALIKDKHPGLKAVLVTNGLGAASLAQEIADAGPDEVLVEMNAVEAETAARLHAWIRPGTRTLPLAQAADIMLADQAKALESLAARGVAVGVRTRVVPGVNSDEIMKIAAKAASLGARRMVLVPTDPGPDAPFPPLGGREVEALRELCLGHVKEVDIEDASGPGSLPSPEEIKAEAFPRPDGRRPCVAVASSDGFDVNLHLGQADNLLIYGRKDGLVSLLGARPAPAKGGGNNRWLALAETLKDCAYLLASGAGNNPVKVLAEQGLRVVVTDGNIEGTVDALYGGGKKNRPGKRPQTC